MTTSIGSWRRTSRRSPSGTARCASASTGGELHDIIARHLGDPFFGIFLNPGHQLHLDEWVNSPIAAGSTIELRSGMAFQVDVIPATGTEYFTTNIEDGIALADASLRAAFEQRYPGAWTRIQARRRFMADQLGIELHPDVLPLLEPAGPPAALPPPTGPRDDPRGMSRHAELVLRSDTLEVVLLPELGGRLHRLRAFGTDLLRTPGDPATHGDEPFFWGAYVMAPWCNRAQPGPTPIAGRTVDLPSNFADGSAIHGQVSARPWEVDADGSLHVTGGGDGWPWEYEVTASALVDGPSLALDYRLVNRSDAPMPGGIGLHPWFLRPVALRIPAEAVYPANAGSTARSGTGRR